MFCALSQNYQHLLKNNICILEEIVQGTQKKKKSIKIKVGQAVLELLIQK